MKVAQFRCNEFAENCFVAYDEATKDAFIVDPGMKYEKEWQAVKGFVESNGLKIGHIFLTHYHIDHILGTGRCAEAFGIGITGSLEDSLALLIPRMQAAMFGFDYDCEIAKVSNDVKEGDTLMCGSHRIEVIDCPGHSFHGLCYYLPEDKMLFTGDVLFYDSIGRSDFGHNMGCDGEKLVEGIKTKLMTLPEDVTVFTGHGPKTSIAQEKLINPFIR